MKAIHALNTLLALVAVFIHPGASAAAQTNGWLTTYSGQYARIYTNNAMQAAGTSLATWSNGSQTQAKPPHAVQRSQSACGFSLSPHESADEGWDEGKRVF